MGEFGPWHLLILAAVFVVLFGAKRLPEAARSLGKSARIMKSELHALHDETPAPVAAAPSVEAH
ncbi:MAG TPA: Sec-independent protein translocase subunit TatA [Mycobacteriales bacterium]|nr:Sec-independent protein translocase subunit TatA [Mycobacteriales bacterium]